MPIEDVQFLLKNSVPDTSLLFIDSSKRDYSAYPTPSEFVIDLQEPIRNVYGIEILDSAIANSMYNVDVQNCNLRFMMIDEADSAALPLSDLASGTVSISDDLETNDLVALNVMTYTLGFASPLRYWLSDASSSMYAVAVVDSSALSASSLPTYDSSQSTSCNYYILVQTKYATVFMNTVVSAYAPVVNANGTGNPWVLFDGVYYSVNDSSTTGHAAAALMTSGGTHSFAIVPASASSSTTTTKAGYINTGYYDVYSYETVQVSQTAFTNATGLTNSTDSLGTPTALIAKDTQIGYNQTPVPVLLTFAIATASVETGNYVTNATFQASLTTAFSQVGANVTMTGTTVAGIDKQSILMFQCPTNSVTGVNQPTYRLLLATSQSTINTVVGLDTHPFISMNGQVRSSRGYGAVKVGGDSICMYASVLEASGQTLVSPGIINLTGVRYVTLRCKEIEEHIETQGKYGPFSTGIGVFKLQSSNNVVQVRADYVNLVRKAFHPIGRLLRMTIRFELSDGSLYDFKGVNNQLLISVKYYAPVAPENLNFRSLLNPDYNYDFQRFLMLQSGYAPRLDDPGYDPYDEDDEEEDGEGDDDPDADDEEDEVDEEPIDEPTMRRFELETQRRIVELEREARSALE